MHKRFLQRAVILACRNVRHHHGGPYGAVIVKDDKIIAHSGNRVAANIDPTAHAEIMAIRLACQRLSSFHLQDCALYCSCEPCPMCLGAIYWARIAEVYYAADRTDANRAGFDDELIYQEVSKPAYRRKIPMQQISLDIEQLPFDLWYQQPNKILY